MIRIAHAVLALAAVMLLASTLPLTAAEPAASLPVGSAADGETLFVVKGCSTCHRHDGIDVPGHSIPVGPDLTYYVPNPDFVRAWLSNPTSLRPETTMPDLDLQAAEIEALLAFLSETPANDS